MSLELQVQLQHGFCFRWRVGVVRCYPTQREGREMSITAGSTMSSARSLPVTNLRAEARERSGNGGDDPIRDHSWLSEGGEVEGAEGGGVDEHHCCAHDDHDGEEEGAGRPVRRAGEGTWSEESRPPRDEAGKGGKGYGIWARGRGEVVRGSKHRGGFRCLGMRDEGG